jgi:hypothetical protein
MTAVAASAASAEEFTAEAGSTTLTGKQTGIGDVFTTTAGTVKCKEVSYKATGIPVSSTGINATPTYPVKTAGGEQNCTGFGFPAEIHTNGCTYTFTLSAAAVTTGALDILCPAGKEITVTAVAAGTTKCTVHVPAQTIASAVTYTNTGTGLTREVDIKANISNLLSYKHVAGTGVGACTTGSGKGSYTGEGIVTGENAAGTAHVGIFLS